MDEETQVQTAEPEVTEPSLDDVISEYKMPETQAQPVKQPDYQPPPSYQTKVDPLDETSFNQFATQVSTGQSVLNEQLQEVKTQLTELQQERQKLQVEADINSTVSKLNENLNLNPKLVRVHLEYIAQEKPGFKALWENRTNNPKAWEKAVGAIGREMRDLYAVRQDSGLTETQTAIQQSQRSLASKNTGGANTLEEKLASAKTDAEFDRLWQQSVNQGM